MNFGFGTLGFAFLMLYAHDVLPARFAWPAGFGDIAIGFATPLVVRALARRPDFATSRRFLAFNLLGLLDFVVAAATASLASGAFAALLSGPVTSAPMETWPLPLFPALFVPVFTILHLSILFQVAARRRVALAPPGAVRPAGVAPGVAVPGGAGRSRLQSAPG